MLCAPVRRHPPLVTDFLVVASAVPGSVLLKFPFLKEMRASLITVCALGAEKYVIQNYLPTRGRLVRVEPLRGKLRCRHIDPISREIIGSRMMTVGGSHCQTARSVTGTGWHAQAWRHAQILLYDKKSLRCHERPPPGLGLYGPRRLLRGKHQLGGDLVGCLR